MACRRRATCYYELGCNIGMGAILDQGGLSEGFCGAWTRTHQSKVNFLDFGGDAIPLIKLSDSFACTKAGNLANLRSLDQQPQHAFEVGDISGNESKSGISDHFAVSGNVAGQGAESFAHRLKQCQGGPLQIGRRINDGRVCTTYLLVYAGYP